MNAAVRHVVALGRTWPGRFILLFVVAQLLIPLRYYVRHRDPHDERYAWRMFSPMRMTRCTPRFVVDERPMALAGEFHEAWLEIAGRGRFSVVEAMGAHVCAKQPPGTPVEVWLDCTYIDGKTQTYGGWDMCQIPRL